MSCRIPGPLLWNTRCCEGAVPARRSTLPAPAATVDAAGCRGCGSCHCCCGGRSCGDGPWPPGGKSCRIAGPLTWYSEANPYCVAGPLPTPPRPACGPPAPASGCRRGAGTSGACTSSQTTSCSCNCGSSTCSAHLPAGRDAPAPRGPPSDCWRRSSAASCCATGLSSSSGSRGAPSPSIGPLACKEAGSSALSGGRCGLSWAGGGCCAQSSRNSSCVCC
mmetsp:Transcript_2118/g.6025  ORF Transcript_2118/g.6025 Transcript_2118/m.6025 type:complete len:220 (-) Transcript_2118:167-826(-)